MIIAAIPAPSAERFHHELRVATRRRWLWWAAMVVLASTAGWVGMHAGPTDTGSRVVSHATAVAAETHGAAVSPSGEVVLTPTVLVEEHGGSLVFAHADGDVVLLPPLVISR